MAKESISRLKETLTIDYEKLTKDTFILYELSEVDQMMKKNARSC